MIPPFQLDAIVLTRPSIYIFYFGPFAQIKNSVKQKQGLI